MKKVLIIVPANDKHKKRFNEIAKECEINYCPESELTKEIVQEANAIIGNPPPELLRGSKNLELLQLSSAGADGYLEKGLLPKGTILTNATGAYGIAVAEHLFALLLFLMKKLDLYRGNQRKHIWKDEGTVSSIYGKTTIILGLGNLGKEFAMRMKAFGSYIIGIKRTAGEKPDFVDEIYTIEELDQQLPKADIVALFLPSTEETDMLFTKDRLLKIKKGAILLNGGRGNVIDPDELYDVIRCGHLSGIGVDVINPEPLPSDSKLWDAENTIITPHVAGGYHLEENLERIISICYINLKAFCGQGEYINIVDLGMGYTV